MLRLTIFIFLTLVGVFAFLSTYGAGDLRARMATPAETAPRPAAQDPGAPGNAAPLPPRDQPPAQPATQPGTQIVQATSQTPEQVQRFPGPPLRPSPEHAGRSPQAVAPPPGTGGPVLYVVGNRVNFRAGPSTGEPVIGALTAGAPVEALGPTGGDWVNIRDSRGRIGFMSRQFLSTEAPG